MGFNAGADAVFPVCNAAGGKCKGGQRSGAPAHKQRNASCAQKNSRHADDDERPCHICDAVVCCGNVFHHIHGIRCAFYRNEAPNDEHIAPLDLPLRKLYAVFVSRQRQQRARVNRNAGIERFLPAHQNRGEIGKPGETIVYEGSFYGSGVLLGKIIARHFGKGGSKASLLVLGMAVSQLQYAVFCVYEKHCRAGENNDKQYRNADNSCLLPQFHLSVPPIGNPAWVSL